MPPKAKAGAKLTAKAFAQKEYEEMSLEEQVAKIKEEHPDNEEEQAAAWKKAPLPWTALQKGTRAWPRACGFCVRVSKA